MASSLQSSSRSLLLASAVLLLCSWSAFPQPTAAAPSVQSPYQLSVFATSQNGYSQPDSITLWREDILIGYQNHVAKDGSDGKSSTIVQYAPNGRVRRTFSVPGHNDGLRVVGASDLWCLQNEDSNPNLVIIDLGTGRQRQLGFSFTDHGGGFDDIAVKNGDVYISLSNPNLDSAGNNVFPALSRARVSGRGSVVELEPVMTGNASAMDIPTGGTVTLNLTDPDSLTIDPRGNLVLNSQSDSELIFIRDPLTPNQAVGRLKIDVGGTATTVDETAFVPGPGTYMLFADVKADTVYRLDNPAFGFEPGTAYCTSDTAGIVGVLNLDNGALTPVATGFGSTRGMVFVSPRAHGKDLQTGEN
ncbi:MAG: hypothetical protein M3O15_15735 [Acidobacteriota bacterium]|nr:hypothetical protein [Acidobacteriota bacterium]